MGVRSFFLGSGYFSVASEEEIDEEIFTLCYFGKGFVYDVARMSTRMRERMFQMLIKQRKRELAEYKKIKTSNAKRRR